LIEVDARAPLQGLFCAWQSFIRQPIPVLFWPKQPTAVRVAALLTELIAEIIPKHVALWSATENDLATVLTDHPRLKWLNPSPLGVVHSRSKQSTPSTQEWVVLRDAPTEGWLEWLVQRRLQYGGQSPAQAHVLFIEDQHLRSTIDRLQMSFAQQVFGDPLKPTTQVGPLVNKASIKAIEDQVPRAILKRMGQLIMGGRQFRPEGLPGMFFQPTLLADVQATSPAVQSAFDGPVMVINRLSQLSAWQSAHMDLSLVTLGQINRASVEPPQGLRELSLSPVNHPDPSFPGPQWQCD
jgi:hypothetical protein